jgi:hypothetical protein
MSLRTWIQDHPAPLVWSWEASAFFLRLFRPVFARMGMETSSKIVKIPEEIIKGALFNCQDCAQCVLHYSGMTCPMNCPKNLRNGPCGGVRLNGHCEVKPEMECVWVAAVRRSAKTPYQHEIMRLNPPVDIRLKGQASWVTYSLGRDKIGTGTDTSIRYGDEALEKGKALREQRLTQAAEANKMVVETKEAA